MRLIEFFNLSEVVAVTDDDIVKAAQRLFTGDDVEDEYNFGVLNGASFDASQGEQLGLNWSAEDYMRLKNYVKQHGLAGGEEPPGGW